MEKKLISAQEVVKKHSLAYHTLNYYTSIGLLPVVFKKGNQRMYDEVDLASRLLRISSMAQEGYPLGLIRKTISGF
jgi:DNA-binding transcriptional MerR regulator